MPSTAAEPLALAVPSSVSAMQLHQWTVTYRAAHGGRFPHAGSGAIPDAGLTWNAVNCALINQSWGWPVRTTLSAWLDTQFPERTARGGDVLAIDQVRRWVDDHRALHDGRFPNAASGAIPGVGVTWHQVNHAMINGTVRLPQHTTLAAWLDQQYPQRLVGRLALADPAIVRHWVDDYRAGHGGAFPAQGSGDIAGTGLTWRALHNAMVREHLGWLGSVTLAAWLDRHYPEERKAPMEVTPRRLRRWVDAWRAAHDGRFPSRKSGQVPDAGRTWSAIEAVMVTHWPGVTSLARWLDQHYPAERARPVR